ncbi:hypothetical protein ACQVPJ_24825 [Bacillus mycoides]|nr:MULTISPECIES: hypothetical protein [Bacillus cereus group]MCQ6568735.1 hypothetical protein [Bacillus mycoides]MDM5431018.1 hypothetical protein [Bacillus mycoides]
MNMKGNEKIGIVGFSSYINGKLADWIFVDDFKKPNLKTYLMRKKAVDIYYEKLVQY